MERAVQKPENPSTLWARITVRPSLLILCGLFLLGFGVRYAVHQQLAAGYPNYYHPAPISDMATHHRLATEIASGKTSQRFVYTNPFYYYFLGMIYSLGGGQESMFFLQNLLGSCVGPLLFLIARAFLPLPAAVLTGILGAIYKPFLFYEQFLLADGLHSIVFVLLLWFLYAVSYEKLLVIGTSALMGIFFLLRPNVLLLMPMILLAFNYRKYSFSRGALILLLCLPWAFLIPLHNYIHGGEALFNTVGFGTNFYVGNCQEATGTLDYTPGFRKLRETASKLPASELSRFWINQTIQSWPSCWGWFGLLGRKFCLLWGAWDLPNNISVQAMEYYSPTLEGKGIISFGFLAPLGLFGLILLLQSQRLSEKTLGIHLAGWLVTWTAVIMPFIILGRYRLPMGSILCLSAGYGIMGLVRPEGKFLPRVLGLALLYVLIHYVVNYHAFLGMPLYGFPPTLRY